MEEHRYANDTADGFFLLLDLLLDGVVLELDGEDGTVAFGNGVEAAGCFVDIEDYEFGYHQIAQTADVVLVL